jgi:hypothetical protein
MPSTPIGPSKASLVSEQHRAFRAYAGAEITWNRAGKGEGEDVMGNSQGRDNVRKRASRRKKTERLAAAKKETAKKAAKK